MAALDICKRPYFPIVSSGNGADWEGLALDIMDELEPVWIGNTGKWVKTNDVGEGEKKLLVVALLVPFKVIFIEFESVATVAVGIIVGVFTSNALVIFGNDV